VSANTSKLVTLGRIGGVHGIKGWLKVHSYTEPRDKIVEYSTWLLARGDERRQVRVADARIGGGKVVVKLEGIEDRDAAYAWVGAEIAVERRQLPPCGPGEYYWSDLEGLEVRTLQGEVLGRVDHLLATGEHDVLVLAGERQRLIPFVWDSVVRRVDLDEGVIVADWAPDY
jgi:16S rRNA processing protein RimM